MLNIVEKNPKVHNAVGGKYIQSKSHLYAHQIKKKQQLPFLILRAKVGWKIRSGGGQRDAPNGVCLFYLKLKV